jgi:thymidylate synthase
MNNLDKKYTDLLQDILDNGVEKQDRTGTGTLSVFGRQIRHKMSEGFPLLTTKKMYMKGIVTELLWFLRGDTNIKYLVDNDCHIWDGDAYKNYKTYMNNNLTETRWCKVEIIGNGAIGRHYTQEEFINKIKTDDEFAKKWGELGKIYGKQWRSWKIGERKLRWSQLREEQKLTVSKETLENTHFDVAFFTEERGIDQIANSISLLKTDPDSRRNIVNAWNVGELDQMVLPPCHYGFQVYTRELSFNRRYRLGNYQPYNIEGKVEYENGLNYITEEQFERFHNSEMDKLNIPRRAISLMWNQRSVDTFLGLPFNIASYGLLLEIIAKEVNMVPDELIGTLGDVHLYSNHIEQAKEQIGRELSLEEREHIYVYDYLGSDIGYNYDGDSELFDEAGIAKRTREPFPLPTLKINTEFWQTESGECGVGPLKTNLQGFEISDFVIENYQSHPTIKAPLSN